MSARLCTLSPSAEPPVRGTSLLGPGRRARGRLRLRDCRVRDTRCALAAGAGASRHQPETAAASVQAGELGKSNPSLTPARRHPQVGVENKSQGLFVSKHNPADLTKPFSAKQHWTASCHLIPDRVI